VAGAIGYFLWSLNRRRRLALARVSSNIEGYRQGPVPGYSYIPGSSLPVSELFEHLDDALSLTSLETLHAGARTRAVLTLSRAGPLPSEVIFTAMKRLATTVAQSRPFKVIAVEVKGAAEGRTAAHHNDAASVEARLVFATDGKGWTGTCSDVYLTVQLPDRAPFRMPAPRGFA
jgi:hypothetical protein